MDMLFKGKSAALSVAASVLVLSGSIGYCGTMGPAVSPGKVYLGVFGGGGAISNVSASQHGTAFYTEGAGGPLAVDAFGSVSSNSSWLVGGHLGYAWSTFALGNIGARFGLMPAVELEGYYIGGTTLDGNDFNNNTTRLDEHNFQLQYPLKTGVFLVNMVLNSGNTYFGSFHPYVGVGLGSAIVAVSKATATQISPPEVGVNHYNSDSSNTTAALALQPKIGISYDVNAQVNVFAEYRYLYVSPTNYIFGSTVVPGHVATSSWQVQMKSQGYNFGTVGINFDV